MSAPSLSYALYLRKSRADLDAEALGEGETLARHRSALRALADRRGLHISREYAELVTGDSIAARPQMQALLDDVRRGLYAGVIVNDVDRLGRGDSIDQEIIKYTFASAHCLIITPARDIDPASPTDQDMLDFSLFFARFELRKISQRLTQGRTRSAGAGNYLSPRVPYGYRKAVNGHDIRLEPDPETAPIVRMIYEWYASRTIGYHGIAQRLNDMGLTTYRGLPFERATVRSMLCNPVYTGRIVWGRTSTVSAIEDGRRVKRTVKSDPVITEHAHPAIISDDLFSRVQDMFAASRHALHTRPEVALVNPLAGLLYCSVCGKLMSVRGGKSKKLITCRTRGCPTTGIYVYDVVDAILAQLSAWCAEYRDPTPDPGDVGDDDARAALNRQAMRLRDQITRAQELVELGVYSPAEYLQRKNDLQQRLDAVQQRLDAPPTVSPSAAIAAAVPAARRVLDAFPLASTVEQQNALLKSVISRVDYSKTHASVRGETPSDYLTVTVYPRIGV